MKNSVMPQHAAKVGVLVVIGYAACLLWKGLITDPSVAELHLKLLKLSLPGFQGFDAMSIAWGAILAFAYGFIFSYIFHSLHRGCCVEK